MAENDKQESVWISIMKTLMKPGYLYGIGEDGELYQVKICSSLLAGWRTAEDEADRVICEVMSDIVTPIVVGTPTVIPAEKDET